MRIAASIAAMLLASTAHSASLTSGAGSAVGAAAVTSTAIPGGPPTREEGGLAFSASGFAGTETASFDAFGSGVAETDSPYFGGAPDSAIAPPVEPLICAIAFVFGDGATGVGRRRGGIPPSRLDHVAIRGGVEVGSGSLVAIVGAIAGIDDPLGFDRLAFRADAPDLARASNALDDVSVAFSPAAIAMTAPA